MSDSSARHLFSSAPQRAVFQLSVPILFSLIAEPLTGLVDTAFVSELGSEATSGLGAAATILSSAYWIFGFLAVGTQTEAANRTGARDSVGVRKVVSAATLLAASIGVVLLIVGFWIASDAARWMGTREQTSVEFVRYFHIRCLGYPALLVSAVAVGALRGQLELKIPLAVAIGVNVLNIALDAVLIHGAGPIPGYGTSGAAWASTVSHLVGAIVLLTVLVRRFGFSWGFDRNVIGRILTVGRDMTIRTTALSLFLILTTRAANRLGEDAGAAHHAIRQSWTFTALFLDAFAATAQSLVALFVGEGSLSQARRAAKVCTQQSVAAGFALAAAMLIGEGWIADLLVPETAREHFSLAWRVVALSQPINAVSFATDGIHWGTSDYPYLRNVTVGVTLASASLLLVADQSLASIWLVAGAWISGRALFGALRVWPAIGNAPLRPQIR
ncbi:MAG: MATE family efflux transporter [Planctomycetota bacterium]